MSHPDPTKTYADPFKYYWAYSTNGINGVTFVFNTYEEALNHAIKKGEFDEICGKDSMIALEENLFFEISEIDLTDELNFEFGKEEN